MWLGLELRRKRQQARGRIIRHREQIPGGVANNSWVFDGMAGVVGSYAETGVANYSIELAWFSRWLHDWVLRIAAHSRGDDSHRARSSHWVHCERREKAGGNSGGLAKIFEDFSGSRVERPWAPGVRIPGPRSLTEKACWRRGRRGERRRHDQHGLGRPWHPAPGEQAGVIEIT